jgi:hypothetical protein
VSDLLTPVRRFAGWQRVDVVLGGVLALAGTGIAAALAVMLLQAPGWLALLGLVPAALLLVRIVRRCTLADAARQIEDGFPVLQRRLVPAVGLALHSGDDRLGYSGELSAAAVADARERLEPLPVGGLLRWPGLRLGGGVLAGALLLLTLALLLARPRLQEGRYLSFFPAQYPLQLQVQPGHVRVEKGSPVELSVKVSSPFAINQVTVVRTSAGNELRDVIPVSDGRATIEAPVQSEFDYSFRVRRRRSETYHVALQQPLEITSLLFRYHYPAYSRLPAASAQSREVSALVGTRVSFEGSADQELADGQLVWLADSGAPRSLSTKGRSFQGEFSVARPAEFELRLRDVTGTRNAPERFRVTPVADEPPFVRLFAPGGDMNLPSSMKVMLGANSVDDYGLSSLVLSFVRDSAVANVPLRQIGGRLEDTTFYLWDVSRLDLLPGSSIRYYVTVYDNDAVSGPKSSRSETFVLRFPTLTDLFSQATEKTAEIESLMTPLSEQQKQLRKETGRLDDAMKRNRQLSWEEQQSLQNLMQNQDSLLAAVKRLHDDVRQAMSEMYQGAVLDSAALVGLKQLDTLLAQVLPKQLLQALDSLRNSLSQANPQNMKASLQKFQLSQADLQKSIERAVELLQRLRQEQELNSLVRQAEELYREQERIQKNPDRESNEQLAQREEQIAQALDSMAGRMAKLGQEFSDQQLARELKELAEQMAKEGMSEQARQAAGDFKQSQAAQAQQKGQQLKAGLKSLQERLQKMKEGLNRRRSADISGKLLQAANDLLTISDAQEEFEQRLDRTRDLSDLVAEENRLGDAARTVAETLAALSMRNMMVPPQLGEPVIKSLRNADDASRALGSGNAAVARSGAQGMRGNLNQGIAAILSTLESAQQSGGFGSGTEGMLEALSQAISGQMGLGQGMGGLPIPMPGGMSEGQMQQWQEMLARQQALRQMLEQMMQQGGQHPGGTQPGMSGSVEAAIEEMKQLEQDLANLNPPRTMIDRSERIVNKLLDAQRSIRQRDQMEQRESETGKAFVAPATPRLPADLGERKKVLREQLMRALKEDFPREYEPQVKAYFDALLRQ